MKYRSLLTIGFLTLGVATGCNSHHDKKWYLQHDIERKNMVEKCSNDAALTMQPECQNAMDAERRIHLYGNQVKNEGEQMHFPSPDIRKFK